MSRNRWKIVAIVLLVPLTVSIIANVHLIYRSLDYRRGANEWLNKYTHVVEEFAKRQQYNSANKKYESDSIVPGRIVLYGTQVTERWNPGEDLPGYQVINRGVTGQWVSGMLLRFRQDVINLMPEYVAIEVSSYNLRPQFSLEEIEECVASMADLARFHGITPVLTTMIPIQEGYETIEEPQRYTITGDLKAYNEWLRDYCEGNGLRFIDFYKILSDNGGHLRGDLSSGPIDPDANGYRLMTEALRNYLE